MKRLERRPVNDPERCMSATCRQALAVRAMLEQVWDETTAFQGITLRPDDKPSRGQCGVSSVWLARFFAEQNLRAQVAEGFVSLKGGCSEDGHVWVNLETAAGPLIVDVASDQWGQLGSIVHVGQYNAGHGDVGKYNLETLLDPLNVPRRKLMKRYGLLDQKVQALPRRKQVKPPRSHM